MGAVALGRGGRYGPPPGQAAGESSTGFTLYMDTLLRALPPPEPERRIYLPLGTARTRGRELRDKGWITVAGFDADADPLAEARRQRCTHAFVGRKIVALED